MADNLRKLLIQRAARLQGRPAFTTSAWGTLTYAQFRNRTEGVSLGLLAQTIPTGSAIFSATGGPWDWASEVAAACCGLSWNPSGIAVGADILGGPQFNDERGRGPYHEREDEVTEDTLFWGDLTHADVMLRLQRMNRVLGWDHDSEIHLPLTNLATPEVRAALWCALYGGGHAMIEVEQAESKGFLSRLRPMPPAWNPTSFRAFWD